MELEADKTVRLLCLSSAALCLLDGATKLVLKRQHSSTLQQWRVGGGVSRHQLLLEFRGAKWQLIASSYSSLKSISITLWEIMQNSAGTSVQKSLNLAKTQRNRSTADSTAGWFSFLFQLLLHLFAVYVTENFVQKYETRIFRPYFKIFSFFEVSSFAFWISYLPTGLHSSV
ncbi:unnamed protein product [Toxocara canis]|uniref:Transmembrane protein n=1 Tax=Toxocara canis TaxID=6265 RepID=A0A183VAU7_TOXCA|nr:unnamed protein product [Toxocara canis]